MAEIQHAGVKKQTSKFTQGVKGLGGVVSKVLKTQMESVLRRNIFLNKKQRTKEKLTK